MRQFSGVSKNFLPACWWEKNFYGEFDPGSGRTLAACLTHASRTMKLELAPVD
jgi:hypothetical protein